MPRMAYVNKMDIMGADFYRVVQMMKDRLQCNAVPIQLPIASEDTFKGIIDLVEMKADVYYDEMGTDMKVEEIPDDMKVALSSCHLPQEAETAPRHHPDRAELGMGIHGEPGARCV